MTDLVRPHWPCFMLYPIPNVADESFVNEVLLHQVRRSIFLGFGRQRFVIAEMQDAGVAHFLAEYLLDPNKYEADPNFGGYLQMREGVLRLKGLLWRDSQRIKIIPSPVTIEDFYACGGQLPKHKFVKNAPVKGESKKAEGAAPAGKEDRTTPSKSFPKGVCQTCGSTDHFTRHCDGSGPASNDANHSTEEPPVGKSPFKRERDIKEENSPPKKSFPKGACQKCGSTDHFTRHCDGSGAAETANTSAKKEEEAVTPVPEKRRKEEQEHPHQKAKEEWVSPKKAETPSPAKTFPKGACQKCGSTDHFTRHCDGGASAPTETPHPKKTEEKTGVEKPPVAVSPPKREKEVKEGNSAAKKTFPKGACQKCGSEDHFTRHCDA
ncbi:Zinc knuckle, putative [Angomonas deanei]|uniref:Zinc knuckle, putative n=1 Tax=Angomonas deanei TaxID=59799 RepID=A0A7G2CNZ2_9TRYP|nr:Zinc knuckle, putative [Angomonas deanei]